MTPTPPPPIEETYQEWRAHLTVTERWHADMTTTPEDTLYSGLLILTLIAVALLLQRRRPR